MRFHEPHIPDGNRYDGGHVRRSLGISSPYEHEDDAEGDRQGKRDAAGDQLSKGERADDLLFVIVEDVFMNADLDHGLAS